MTLAGVPPVLSVIVALNANVPDCVGVPDKVPLAALKLTPTGSAPLSTTWYGATPPVAVIAC